ncbi:hypothetical protein S245_063300 [Arachis hypogaea]|nr:uncharacterized protein DS421_18g618310 [Arachis hypogaea]
MRQAMSFMRPCLFGMNSWHEKLGITSRMHFGQLILAAAGVAKDRKCTAFPPVKLALVASGTHWVEPDTMAAKDDNLITAATYEGHPEFNQHFTKAPGGNISGSNKKILFLCGVRSNDFQAHNS